MSILQRTLLSTAAATLLASAFTLPVLAQAASDTEAISAPQHTTPHTGSRPDRTAQRLVQQERLKTLLQLTPAQEGAWQTYQQALRHNPPLQRLGQFKSTDAPLTTPERIAQQQKIRGERNAQAQQREAATTAFYAELTPAQQKAFDTALSLRNQRATHRHKNGAMHQHRTGSETHSSPAQHRQDRAQAPGSGSQ